MSHLSRREWNKLMFGGLAASALPLGNLLAADKPNSKFNGVQIGVQSYSFRDRSLDEAIKGMVEVSLSSCELWQGHVEPKGLKRDELAKWRQATSLDEFKNIRKKFDAAGVELYAYNYSFREDFSDAEIERGFQLAKALGVKAITASSNVSTAKRIDPFARKYKLRVGMHNHSNIKANEFATPDDFAAAMKGMSEYICINLDIGHFTAAGFDPVSYLEQHHDRIITLHIKDRKKNQGPNMLFGEGDTNIKGVLKTLEAKKYPIPAMIEYEYKGADPIAEVKKCYAYMKQVLES
jgi:sugar phosphate isomerase/epimerase